MFFNVTFGLFFKESPIFLDFYIGDLLVGNDFFSKRIKQLRTENNLTLEKFGEKVGANKTRVSMWETKGTVPRQDVLLKICKEFNVSVDYLLGNAAIGECSSENLKLTYLQRKLGELDKEQLETADQMLSAVFKDIFNDRKK